LHANAGLIKGEKDNIKNKTKLTQFIQVTYGLIIVS